MGEGFRASEGRLEHPSFGGPFVEAISFLKRWDQKTLDLDEVTLAHGIVHGAGDYAEERKLLAWLELGGRAEVLCVIYSHGSRVIVSQRSYYEEGRIADVKKYPARRALELARETGTCGPWDERLIALATKGDQETDTTQEGE